MAQNVPKTKGVQASPCPGICQLVPTNVPEPRKAQSVLHPRKDVFILRVDGAPLPRSYYFWVVWPFGPAEELPHIYDTNFGQLDIAVGPRVAKIGVTGERRSKMELELVTPKGPERKVPGRIDTRGTQCLPPPCPGCCQRIQC